jgi:hypothetical protein
MHGWTQWRPNDVRTDVRVRVPRIHVVDHPQGIGMDEWMRLAEARHDRAADAVALDLLRRLRDDGRIVVEVMLLADRHVAWWAIRVRDHEGHDRWTVDRNTVEGGLEVAAYAWRCFGVHAKVGLVQGTALEPHGVFTHAMAWPGEDDEPEWEVAA